MHCVVGRLGLFLHAFFFRFKGFFRCFIILILRWFNHEELALFAAMFAAPRFVVMPTQLIGRSFVKLVSCQLFWCRGLDGSRGGSRPRHGCSGSDPYPSYLVVQLFFLDMREENHRHKSVRLGLPGVHRELAEGDRELTGSSPKVIGSVSGVHRKMIERLAESSSEDARKFIESSEDRLTCRTIRMIIIVLVYRS
ncbi:hypothetical protein GW17_00045765 [Ensete ventricosum]|nr:hypothetical protein GW17_00045765 [Ensete ventricosum]